MESARGRIESILRLRFRPLHLELHDGSDRHIGHPGATSGGGHYDLVIVSAEFEGKALVEQHRMVYEALGDLIGKEIHALEIKTVPPSQWGAQGSPPRPAP